MDWVNWYSVVAGLAVFGSASIGYSAEVRSRKLSYVAAGAFLFLIPFLRATGAI